MSNETFKTKMDEMFIPAVRRMVLKEEKHLADLKKARKRLHDTTMVDGFIERSEADLVHLRTRLQQYIEFVAKL